MKKYCFALDLIEDEELILAYKNYHKNVWPEITQSIKDGGVEELEIYLVSNRLFMIMKVNDGFSFEKKAAMDGQNPRVQEWERLMWKYQKKLPCAKEREKWILMDKIYSLK